MVTGRVCRRRYTEESKRDAVALVRSSGRTVTEVARELGVSAEGLRNRVGQDQVDRGRRASNITGKVQRGLAPRLGRLRGGTDVRRGGGAPGWYGLRLMTGPRGRSAPVREAAHQP
ncbi:transposase [Streptomyces sp. NPDC127066]|uniref:transposase n=1 Tax=Streptomyces sp. NPDC127066 TaxID=3347125 RepID=UPI003669EBBB